MATPLRLKGLSPERVAAAIAADPRLIIPIGTNDPYGPHLPLGADSIIVDRLADDLSTEFGVLRAATVEYGASDEAAHGPPRAGSVRKKTLHLLLNDLLLSWERAGIREFILLTYNGDDAHREALATVLTLEARVRVVDARAPTSVEAIGETSARGGEADTSLILYLAPELVDMRLAKDYTPEVRVRRRKLRRREQGANGKDASADPSRATRERGESLYELVRQRIGERILRGAARSHAEAP
jgi:creatinine amidohydrolase